jgi:hypothetical protein
MTGKGVRNDRGRRGQVSPLLTREILSTKYEMLNNIETQNLNDQNVRFLNLEFVQDLDI